MTVIEIDILTPQNPFKIMKSHGAQRRRWTSYSFQKQDLHMGMRQTLQAYVVVGIRSPLEVCVLHLRPSNTGGA